MYAGNMKFTEIVKMVAFFFYYFIMKAKAREDYRVGRGG